MTGPEVSPLLARIGGDSFRSDLKTRLEELARETDDPAYASRLRLVARGDRPLRTLLHDPQWTQQFEPSLDLASSSEEVSNEERQALDERFSEVRARQAHILVSPEQAKADAEDIARIAEGTREAVRQESLSGWSCVHEVDREADGASEGSRDR